MDEFNRQLQNLVQRMTSAMPPAARKADAQALEDILASGIAQNALAVGDAMPAFALRDVAGLTVNSESLLEFGPLAITFYRGGWCPYCSLELRAFQEIAHAIDALRSTLVAISPERPDFMLMTRDVNHLAYEFLHDAHNAVARSFGLVFEVPPPLRAYYRDLGIDLPVRHGEPERWELPVPATYVVGQDGIITLAFVTPDYRQRLDPGRVLEELRRLDQRRND